MSSRQFRSTTASNEPRNEPRNGPRGEGGAGGAGNGDSDLYHAEEYEFDDLTLAGRARGDDVYVTDAEFDYFMSCSFRHRGFLFRRFLEMHSLRNFTNVENDECLALPAGCYAWNLLRMFLCVHMYNSYRKSYSRVLQSCTRLRNMFVCEHSDDSRRMNDFLVLVYRVDVDTGDWCWVIYEDPDTLSVPKDGGIDFFDVCRFFDVVCTVSDLGGLDMCDDRCSLKAFVLNLTGLTIQMAGRVNAGTEFSIYIPGNVHQRGVGEDPIPMLVSFFLTNDADITNVDLRPDDGRFDTRGENARYYALKFDFRFEDDLDPDSPVQIFHVYYVLYVKFDQSVRNVPFHDPFQSIYIMHHGIGRMTTLRFIKLAGSNYYNSLRSGPHPTARRLHHSYRPF